MLRKIGETEEGEQKHDGNREESSMDYLEMCRSVENNEMKSDESSPEKTAKSIDMHVRTYVLAVTFRSRKQSRK